MKPEQRHLICSIGLGSRPVTPASQSADTHSRYQFAIYHLDGREDRPSRFAPAALARLLDLHGARATILATAAAHEAPDYEALATELREAGLDPVYVPMPEGRTEDEVLDIFNRLVERVEPRENLVLDVTFSLRHLPFVYLAALTYLTAYRRVAISGIYYGAWDLRDSSVGGPPRAPILNVTPLYRLTEWYHAVRSAQESGDVRVVARMLESDVADLFRSARGDPRLSGTSKTLNRLAASLAAALPLEVAVEARTLARSLAALDSPGTSGHLARLSLDIFPEWLEQWAAPEGIRDKGSLSLSLHELSRQLQLARWYADRNDLHKTLLLLREWLVNLVLFRRADPARWLELEYRQQIADYLNSLVRRARYSCATSREAEVAGVWAQVAELRNQFAHVGMTTDVVKVQERRKRVEDILSRAQALLDDDAAGRLPRAQADGVRLLVAPLGLTPGALYSALCRLRPDRAFVVTSGRARQRLAETLEAAQCAGTPTFELELAEPLTGFAEAKKLINRDGVRQWLAESDEVIVSLTGGSTVMGYTVQRVAEEAERLGVAVHRVAMVDRRSPQEQQEKPYVLGQLIWLNEEDEDDAPAT